MITVAEISECFPNKYKPVTGEFVLQHAKALSELCRVIMIVPVRYIPPKELFEGDVVKTVKNISEWYSSLRETESFAEGNMMVMYIPYVSLPRSAFQSLDNHLIIFFFYNKVRQLLEPYEPDIIYCHWLQPWSQLSCRLAEEYKIPFIIDHHEDIPTLKNNFPASYKEMLRIFNKADGVIVHSTVNMNDIIAETGTSDLKLIYLGQNFLINETAKVFNDEKLRLACVSHLSEKRKNIDDLIRAVALIKDKVMAELTIAGDGILRKEYEDLSKEVGADSFIKFIGQANQEEVCKVLDGSDIFVLPSYPEAFGIVFIEALARGIPVITCKGSGGGEELSDLNYPVVLVDPDSPQKLADEILQLYNDKDKMEQMSAIGKQIVRNNFTWKMNAENTFSYLKNKIDYRKK